ncbi:MAG: DUF262 domain-containing HNH endonuclease family protein [Thermosynechococcaceae cyanobacterium MS004]|nr:DUF262 domain-containing HNH endonuclease family protein [Thermosynechococcaceae cyanobacterium MS004]
MARVNLLETRTANFGELIGNGKIYKVPPFQRDYSWKKENWEDLWQDILALHADSDASHYMGALVLQSSGSSDKVFTIIDGQQRLATLSIIAIAVIEKIRQLVLRQRDPENNQARLEILKRTYLGDKDPRSLRYSSKLLLNEINDDFYQSNLINNLRPPRNIRALKRSNQLLWQAFEYFSTQLGQLPEIVEDGEKLAIFLQESIAQQLLFIQINVEDELNAYTVFETLNARGIELSSTDLLKNYIFSLFQGPDDLNEAQRQWRRIISAVQMERFPEFLRYYLSLKHSRVRRERLFKLVRDEVKDAQQAFRLLDQLEEYSSLFIALGNANDEFWNEYQGNSSDIRELIRELEMFRVKQAYPALFAAYQKFPTADFTRLLKLVTVISFRYGVVSSLNPNDLELLYNRVAIAICDDEITTPRQVFEKLKPIYVPDEKFQQDFSLLAITTKGQKKKVVRYILYKLEVDARKSNDVSEDSFSIEHILPENSSSEWQQDFTDAQLDEMVYRLGNLTPLEISVNRDIGQQRYSIKQQHYSQSAYVLTQQVMAEEWTPNTIAMRQERLAKRAVQIWKADFL